MNNELTTTDISNKLRELAEEIAEEYRNQIDNTGTNASGRLRCFSTDIEIDDKGYRVIFTLPEYWKYVETGTKPHFPPIKAIKDWIQVKPIIPRPDKYGKIPTTDQLAYMIAKKIGEEGTPAKNLLETALTNSNPDIINFIEELSDSLTREFTTIIDTLNTKKMNK